MEKQVLRLAIYSDEAKTFVGNFFLDYTVHVFLLRIKCKLNIFLKLDYFSKTNFA